ncbi:MAG: hypothetical protein AABX74_00870 [Nanoarchaeota archaeon]
MAKQKQQVSLPKLDFTDKKQGFAAVLIGILAALILGALAYSYSWPIAWLYWLLALGVAVGILNIFHEEGILFLISGLTITLMLTLLVSLALFPLWAVALFNSVIYLLAPATVVVGLKVLYALATK